MMISADRQQNNPVTTYYEKRIGKTIYCVTNVYLGEIELGKALEDLAVKRVLRDEGAAVGCRC